MATLKLVANPTEFPATTAEAKTYLRVDGSYEDARILTMIKAATKRLEHYCDQKFISQDWIQYMDRWPCNVKDEWWDGVRQGSIAELYSQGSVIELLTGPLISVTEFNTYSDNGIAQLFASTNYSVDTASPQGRIGLNKGNLWPTTILRSVNGIEIKFKAGISADADNLPEDIKQAVLIYVASLFEHRGDEVDLKIPATALLLLEPYRRHKVGGMRIV